MVGGRAGGQGLCTRLSSAFSLPPRPEPPSNASLCNYLSPEEAEQTPGSRAVTGSRQPQRLGGRSTWAQVCDPRAVDAGAEHRHAGAGHPLLSQPGPHRLEGRVSRAAQGRGTSGGHIPAAQGELAATATALPGQGGSQPEDPVTTAHDLPQGQESRAGGGGGRVAQARVVNRTVGLPASVPAGGPKPGALDGAPDGAPRALLGKGQIPGPLTISADPEGGGQEPPHPQGPFTPTGTCLRCCPGRWVLS